MISKMAGSAAKLNLKPFGSMADDLFAVEVLTFFIELYGIQLPSVSPPKEILQILNDHEFKILRCINTKFKEDINNGG